MSLPEYPMMDNGEPDHHAAIREMFGRVPSDVVPVYVNIDGSVLALTRVFPTGSKIFWRMADDYGGETARSMKTEEFWDEWVNGSLMPVRAEYLAADEDVYNIEEQTVEALA
jgi:hypothetical protein